jgi:hypothetical protein
MCTDKTGRQIDSNRHSAGLQTYVTNNNINANISSNSNRKNVIPTITFIYWMNIKSKMLTDAIIYLTY